MQDYVKTAIESLTTVESFFAVGVSFGIYYLTLATANLLTFSTLFRKRIPSWEEAVSLVRSEAGKRGIEPSRINVYRGDYNSTHSVRRNGDGFDLRLNENGDFFTRAGIRHELDHIANGDLDTDSSVFYYFFVAEPRVILQEWKRVWQI